MFLSYLVPRDTRCLLHSKHTLRAVASQWFCERPTLGLDFLVSRPNLSLSYYTSSWEKITIVRGLRKEERAINCALCEYILNFAPSAIPDGWPYEFLHSTSIKRYLCVLVSRRPSSFQLYPLKISSSIFYHPAQWWKKNGCAIIVETTKIGVLLTIWSVFEASGVLVPDDPHIVCIHKGSR